MFGWLIIFSFFVVTASAGQEGCSSANPDFETCLGFPVPGEPQCLQGGYQYIFPQVATCNARSLQFSPADAGTGTVVCQPEASGCNPEACVVWNRPGLHKLTITYDCMLGYSETRSRCVLVSLQNFNYAQFELDDVTDCSGFYTGFRLIRSLYLQNGPVKRWRIEVWETDAAGNIIAPSPYWSNGWNDGDIREQYFDNASHYPGLYFNTDRVRYYRVRLLTTSACGSHEYTHPQVIVANPPVWNANFDINGSNAFPIELYACNNAPMVLNDKSTKVGCYNLPKWRARITMEQSDDCGEAIPGTAIVREVAYSDAYNLRTLFPVYATQSGWYKVSYELRGGWSAPYGAPMTKCVRISELDESNAEFKLISSQNQAPTDRTDDPQAPNTVLGPAFCGILFQGYVSQSGSIDKYKIQIWRTTIVGDPIATILDGPFVNLNPPFQLPPLRQFNDQDLTNGYFFNLTQQQRLDFRFKVRLTVVNECGTVFKESFFRIDPNCTWCLVDEGADDRSASSGNGLLEVHVRPNPVRDVLQVDVSGLSSEELLAFEIIDVTGKVVMRNQLTHGVHRIGVDQLASGAYLWRAVTGSEMRSGQLIKP
ncbi:MAG: T9SS type A sorting domain-containing protein [Saprospiraceae bacterium]|nr:T9SS type A sorting domain-containing protein [Saprospiraceae bacterium]